MVGLAGPWPRRGLQGDAASLRRQLVLLAGVLATLVALALVGVVQVVLAGSSTDTVRRVLSERAAGVVAAAETSSSATQLSVPDVLLGPGVAVYDDRGALVAGQIPPSLSRAFTRLSTATKSGGMQSAESYRMYAEPFRTSAGVSGVVVVAEPLAPYENDEYYALLVSLAAGGVIVVVALALAGWTSRRALAPVADMALTADQWSEKDLDRRFDLGPPTNEIRALGHTLDGLLDKVAHAIQAEQRLTSELAHELRSPLTAVQATAEMMSLRDDLDDQLREDIADVQLSCRTMSATITGLLDLARAQSSTARDDTTDLRDVLESVRRALSDPQRVRVEVAPGIEVAVPSTLTTRAIAPVVDNAVRFGAHVTITASLSADEVRVRVCDDGPGVATELAGSLFEPGRTSGEGSGLGLALARRIARSVGGDVIHVPTPPSAPERQGAVFEVTLPLA